MIMQMAGQQAREGVVNFLLFMALISINLGILNLLPIPVLDGGHLFFMLFEAVFGKPLSVRKMEIAQNVGLALLVLLMVFAFYNDLSRIFHFKGFF
jgi:regulator of sigma E protease